MIDLIEVETMYLGIHAINTVTFDAILPRDKQKAFKLVNSAIEKLDNEFLNSVPERQAI